VKAPLFVLSHAYDLTSARTGLHDSVRTTFPL
jgi:hypothetical protein